MKAYANGHDQPACEASLVLANPRHERFAQLIAQGVSNTAACMQVYPTVTSREVGCANGSRLLRNAKVSSRVCYLQAQIACEVISAAIVTEQNILKEYARIGFANFDDFMSMGDDGLPRLNWSRLTREQKAALAEVTVDVVGNLSDDEDEPRLPVTRVRFKLHPKLAALEALARKRKMFTDRIEQVVPPETEERRSGARKLMLALLDARARGTLPASLCAALDEMAASRSQR